MVRAGMDSVPGPSGSGGPWCSFESVPPPTPFDQGCVFPPEDAKSDEDPVFGGKEEMFTAPCSPVPLFRSDPENRGAPGYLALRERKLDLLSALHAHGEDEDLFLSKDASPSNSSAASDARISSAPLCSGQGPEHTLSDISGPCSSDKVPVVADEFKLVLGTRVPGSTTTSTSSLSDSGDSETEDTEDHREFCLLASIPRVESRGDAGESACEFHVPLEPEVVPMTVDTCEDYWTRLHDVRINGCVLEYTGIGKTLHDNGFAQSSVPLTPLSHYFEITILNPGESCYIAIGLARKDYNMRKNPGWCRGSIAYHADDGKIFIGGGVGTPFGPRCGVQDVLGCGVIFPVKYGELSPGTAWPWEVDDATLSSSKTLKSRIARRRKARGYNTDNFEDISSESEDDIWWNNRNQVCEDKVQVFFMRNHKLLGIKEVRIPKGGFYPTIGMMSTNERVSVDLHPLTG